MRCCGRLVDSREATYSRPLSYVGFTKESVEVNGEIAARRAAPEVRRRAPRATRQTQWLGDLAWRIGVGLAARAGRGRAAVAGAAGAASAAAPARPLWQARVGAAWHGEGQIPWRVVCWTLAALGLLAGPAVDAGRPLPRARHRPDRQRRALPGAEEHPHGLCHRHAGDGGDAAAGGGLRHPGGLLPRLGRRGHPVPLHRAVVGAERAAHRRLRADGAGVHRQEPASCSRPAPSAPT